MPADLAEVSDDAALGQGKIIRALEEVLPRVRISHQFCAAPG